MPQAVCTESGRQCPSSNYWIGRLQAGYNRILLNPGSRRISKSVPASRQEGTQSRAAKPNHGPGEGGGVLRSREHPGLWECCEREAPAQPHSEAQAAVQDRTASWAASALSSDLLRESAGPQESQNTAASAARASCLGSLAFCRGWPHFPHFISSRQGEVSAEVSGLWVLKVDWFSHLRSGA